MLLYNHYYAYEDLLNALSPIYTRSESFMKNGSYIKKSKEGKYYSNIEIPGYSKDDVSVETDDESIYVVADNKERGKLSLSFTLNDLLVDKAECKNGILKIDYKPKKEEKRKKVTIL